MPAKNNKFSKNTRDNLLLTGALSILMMVYIGISIRQVQDNNGNLYTPGESIKKSERAAVNAMQDSTLNARVAQYNKLLADYKSARECAVAPNAHISFEERTVHPYYQKKLKAANLGCMLPRTLRDYKNILNDYARDSVETRYQELRDMLNAQKSKQK